MSRSYSSQRKYESKSKNRQLTRHHIVAKEKWWSDEDMNIKLLPRKNHKGLHDYFQNKKPHEQIMQVLEDSNSALTRKFKKNLRQVLQEFWYEDMIYKNGVFRRR